MSGSINFSGLSSGIDSNSIIDQLIAVDRQPENSIKIQQQYLQQRQTAYNTVSAKLLGLQASTYSLDALRAFNIVTADSSAATVATVSAATGAQTGTHAINVANLAQSQVIGSVAQTSQTAPLNQHGQIIVNGKAINYQDADSLQSLAANINSAQAGVTASIITPTNGQYYLTLGSTNSGIQGKISLSDAGSGNLLGGDARRVCRHKQFRACPPFRRQGFGPVRRQRHQHRHAARADYARRGQRQSDYWRRAEIRLH